ncbi:MAG: acyltransferase [Bacteroidales bacterium]|nr:acyltransferase [Bacteroidales bacterium]
MEEQFLDICPYSDEEAVKAFGELAKHPAVPVISKAIFPNERITFLSDKLKNLGSIDEFQQVVMTKAVDWVLNNTIGNFSYDGFSNILSVQGKFLMISNHRDIIIDPALTQYVLAQNGVTMSEICVGDNLLSSPTVEKLLRSNRMIKVIRGISARELYLSSQLLSKYIRQTITSGKNSVWIAQRQGRTKNGFDETEQGLVKMFDMSGTGTFQENYSELNLIPLSISYEYEPCDIRKARELLISRTQKYVKGPKEDMHSIVSGIRQWKGNVHLNIGTPLAAEEIETAAGLDKNDRYQALMQYIDQRVVEGYKLWKTNFIAYDMVYGTTKYSDRYTAEDREKFIAYTEHQLKRVERTLNREDLRDVFRRIYSNPVENKEIKKAEI